MSTTVSRDEWLHRAWSLSGAALLIPSLVFAQHVGTTSLSGIVFGPTGAAIVQVQVLLDHADLVAVTDAAGYFRVDSVIPGAHTLTFSKHGFGARTYRFTLPDHPEPETDLGAILLEPLDQSFTRLSGTVVDSMTVEPIAAAQLRLDDEVVGMSDVSGSFRLEQVTAGFHTLEIRRIGYQPTFVDFDVPVGQERVGLVVKMKALPAQLPEVVVEGERTIYARGKLREFYERMQAGFGHFITRSEIEKRSARVPTELFYGVPGLQVIPGAFGTNTVRLSRVTTGCRSPVVFLDGARISGADLDQILNPQDIAGIEVYTRASEVPPTFNVQGGAACGVIVVWTL